LAGHLGDPKAQVQLRTIAELPDPSADALEARGVLDRKTGLQLGPICRPSASSSKWVNTSGRSAGWVASAPGRGATMLQISFARAL